MGGVRKERALVLVKAFPQPSAAYEETVCCAGITPDGDFVRLYPIRFRHLPKDRQFTRWDVLEYEASQPRNDHRPESRHVNEDTIRIVQRATVLSEQERLALWAPHVSPSIAALKELNGLQGTSLGIVCPDPNTLRFRARKLDVDERAAKRAEFKQASLLDESFLPGLQVDYEFSYQFTCAGAKHSMIIHDWEVQGTYFRWKQQYGAENVINHMEQRFGKELCLANLHFVMGTMHAHPKTFIVIGLLRSKIFPSDVLKQAALL